MTRLQQESALNLIQVINNAALIEQTQLGWAMGGRLMMAQQRSKYKAD
jgi:hypothetical protein